MSVNCLSSFASLSQFCVGEGKTGHEAKPTSQLEINCSMFHISLMGMYRKQYMLKFLYVVFKAQILHII